MRYQGSGPGRNDATIYGPPGTRGLVNGLRAAFQSGSALVSSATPTFHVIELNDGSKLDIGGIYITNSHYNLWKRSGPKAIKIKNLSVPCEIGQIFSLRHCGAGTRSICPDSTADSNSKTNRIRGPHRGPRAITPASH
jgi:hypothetical protein